MRREGSGDVLWSEAMRRAALGLAAVTLGAVALPRPTQAQSAAVSAAAGATLPSVELPPALARVLRDYASAWRAGDANPLVELFTEDGFVLQPGQPPVHGREALRSRYQGQGGGPLRLRALAFAVDGTVGCIIGAYGYGDAPGDMGKFTLTPRPGHRVQMPMAPQSRPTMSSVGAASGRG